MVSLLGEEFRDFANILCERRPRYVKEQLALLVAACEKHGREIAMEAMNYCITNELFSGNDLLAAAESLAGNQVNSKAAASTDRLPIDDEKYHVNVEKRALSVYAKAAKGASA